MRRKRSDSAAAGTRETEAPAPVARDDYDNSMDAPTGATRPSLNKPKLSRILAAAYSLDALFRNATEKKKVPGGAARLARCGRGLLCSRASRRPTRSYNSRSSPPTPRRFSPRMPLWSRISPSFLDTKRRFLKDSASETEQPRRQSSRVGQKKAARAGGRETEQPRLLEEGVQPRHTCTSSKTAN